VAIGVVMTYDLDVRVVRVYIYMRQW